MKPEARSRRLLLRELPGELLVYDQERHTAHCLNRTAAIVFRACDGSRTVDDIARLLDPALGPEARDAVALALEQIAAGGLLEAEPASRDGVGRAEAPAGGLTRRDVARRVGLAAAILLPAVATVVAPTPAEAAATCVTSCAGQPHGTPCSISGGPVCPDICSCGGGTCSAGDCTDGSA